MPVSIMLDAGHGGRDPGAVYNGRQEKDDVLKVEKRSNHLKMQQDFLLKVVQESAYPMQ